MDAIRDLSVAQCILLAASLAADSDILALYQLTPAREDAFDLSLVLRILLTYLPETLQPSKYTTYLHEFTTRVYLEQHDHLSIDCSSVQKLSESQAQKQVRHMHLLPLTHPSIAENDIQDPLIEFLIHRSHRIDTEAGLLPLVPELLEPFLDRSTYLRDWLVATILPLVRLDFEYYPDDQQRTSLSEFERFSGSAGVERVLSKTERSAKQGIATQDTVGRDFKGILGPWIYGSNQRKRRKLNEEAGAPLNRTGPTHVQRARTRPNELDYEAILEDWQAPFQWIVARAKKQISLAVHVIESWGGPLDVDFAGYRKAWLVDQRDTELAEKLSSQYHQTAFAVIYATEDDTSEALDYAHSVLVRLAEIMDFEPPPDLATSIRLLPKIESQTAKLDDMPVEILKPDKLLESTNPLTIPKTETFSLLQMLVYSAYQLAGLGYTISVVKVAKLGFWSDDNEQLKIMQRILHGLLNGAKKDEEQWSQFRDTLLWLWDWAIENEGDSPNGCGVLGKIDRHTFEKEILQAFCKTGHYALVKRIYINSSESPLVRGEVENVIISVILHYYDNASNGNRTRGGVKRASDLVSAFREHFSQSLPFRRCSALLSAAHALSFYSLTLQHGVPFQPVSIRVNEDPISLINKVLDQNARSYTKLDDLIEIGSNITVAHLSDQSEDQSLQEEPRRDERLQIRLAERRVTGMAIEAALAEEDFETAYSYVINRLTPPSTSTQASSAANGVHEPSDDISWRAAFQAGSYRPRPSYSARSQALTASSPQVRQLEQRMELLSQSLLLAPPSALSEVLASWRRCEEELLTLLEKETEAEHAFDDRADKKEVLVPGGFGAGADVEPLLSVQPKRKELGRGAVEEAPMGLFEVARGAAAALGRSAGGLAGKAGARSTMARAHMQGQTQRQPQQRVQQVQQQYISTGDGDGRVRKRDMVASAVTGGLASGLGWVLGATPVHEQQEKQDR